MRCVHLDKPRDEHDRKHATRAKASCGWCCYRIEKKRADKLQAKLDALKKTKTKTKGKKVTDGTV